MDPYKSRWAEVGGLIRATETQMTLFEFEAYTCIQNRE